jgi:hypothetical protein
MKEFPLADYLDCLYKVTPPTGIVHIGVGAGIGLAHHWRQWGIPYAVLVDAEANRYDWLKNITPLLTTLVFSEVVSDQKTETTFYIATNPEQSGLIPTEKLNPIWPDLATIETRNIESTTLLEILDGLPIDFTSQINWIVVDCFPALNVLKGVTDKYLDQASIILLRVVFDETKLDETLAVLGLSVIDMFLTEKGYKLLGVDKSDHPAVGLALFYKDSRATCLQRKLQCIEEQQQLQLLEAEKHNKNQQKSIADLNNEFSEIEKLAESRLQQIQNTEQIIKEKNQHILQLEAEIKETVMRQQLLNEEMLKVEGQIDLLKDIFLREIKL